jgi:putative ABC transport system permease protein
MKTADLFEETYFSLTVNKARSFLTMLGIVIGIGSVIAMVSIGQGTQSSITATIQSIGSNLIIVTAGAQRSVGSRISEGFGSAQTLTMADEVALSQQLTQVKAVDAELSRRYQITAKGTNTNTQVVGTTSNYQIIRNVNIDTGSFITDQQVADLSKVAVLGPTTRDNLFGQGVDPTGQTIKINNIQFKVIGVTVSKGGSGFTNQDDIVFIPISVAQHFLVGSNTKGEYYVSTVAISAESSDVMTSVQDQATAIMMRLHGISDIAQADFTVQNQADIASAASSVTGTLTMLLAAIAGISLVVGGIGIMNMMLTTVTERTREIGLRKAIGAKRKDISTQFLAESVMLTFIGGIFGILIGVLVAFAVTQFAGIATQISYSSVIMAFGVSAGIGILFGYYPARRAASLNPIEALRYE